MQSNYRLDILERKWFEACKKLVMHKTAWAEKLRIVFSWVGEKYLHLYQKNWERKRQNYCMHARMEERPIFPKKMLAKCCYICRERVFSIKVVSTQSLLVKGFGDKQKPLMTVRKMNYQHYFYNFILQCHNKIILYFFVKINITDTIYYGSHTSSNKLIWWWNDFIRQPAHGHLCDCVH